ncbi:MAG: sulfatase [Gemmatimonadaceae bacterium]
MTQGGAQERGDPVTSRDAADSTKSESISPGRIILTAVFFALVTGLGQAAILLVLKAGFDMYIHFEPQVAWMSPVAHLLVYAPPALILLLVHRLRPRAVTVGVVVGVFVFLSVASLLVVNQKLHSVAIALLALGLGAEVGRRAMANRTITFRRLRQATFALVVVVLALAIAVEGGRAYREQRELARLPEATAGSPNVLFIILDTVRALNLSLYGYSRPTTPNLEHLAKRGIVFDRAIVTAPWTLPSHASMLTGQWPNEFKRIDKRPLELKVPTLTEVLRENGYSTAGFVSNFFFLSRESGLTGGFIHYEDFDYSFGTFLRSTALFAKVISKPLFHRLFGYPRVLARKNARELNEDVLHWLEGEERPFFAFINYMDAHAPVLPAEPFDTIFDRRVRGRAILLGEERNKSRKPTDVVEVEVAAYDGALAYLDHELGRLFGELDRRGILQNTVVVVTSDHGEELAERGDWGHGSSLYMEVLRVPLIIVPPASEAAGVRVLSPVSLRSLPSTLVDLLGVRTNVVFPGRSLAHHWRLPKTTAMEPADTVLAQVHGRTSVIADRYHYFRDRQGEHLYDHYNDVLEQENLASASEYQSVLKSLKALAEGVTPTVQESK